MNVFVVYLEQQEPGAPRLGIEFSGQLQDTVTNGFRLQATGRESPEQSAVGIDLARLGDRQRTAGITHELVRGLQST